MTSLYMPVIKGKVVIQLRAYELESIKFHAKILQQAAKGRTKNIVRDVKQESLAFWSIKAFD